MSRSETHGTVALFCNGFDGIVAKIDHLSREKFQTSKPAKLIVYLSHPTRKFHVDSPFEAEIRHLQPDACILRGTRDCLGLIKKPYDILVVPQALGAKRTLLAWTVALLTRASLFEFDLYQSTFRSRSKIGYLATLLGRVFSRRTVNRILLTMSSYFKLARLLGYPVNMNVETVSVCNLKCPACATGLNKLGRAQGFMDLDNFRRMVGECGPYMNNMVLHIYGEPLLHKQINSFIRSAKDAGVRHVELSTNGNIKWSDEQTVNFVKSGLDTLIVSVDGADEETYQTYRRGGKLSAVVDFTKAVVQAKQHAQSLTPIIEVQFIIMKHNIHQEQQARELALSLGADSFRSKMFDATFADIGVEAALTMMPEVDSETSYRVENGKLVSKFATDTNFCPIIWDTAAMTWDGHLIPCCFDEKGSVVLGDSFHVENRFWDVWNSRKFVGFRKAILKDRKKIPLCKDCPFV